MHPYSVGNYFKQNKRRFISITLATFLGVFVVYGLSMLIGGLISSYERSTVDLRSKMTEIYARGSTLSPSLVTRLDKEETVADYMPVVSYSIPVRLMIGGYNNTALYILSGEDTRKAMEKLDLKLVDGRLPNATSLEVVLHANVAKGLGLHVGDKIGSGLNNMLWLPEEYTVVGIVDGKPLVSFGQLLINNAYKYGILVFPKDGQLEKMNSQLKSLENRSMTVVTYQSDKENLDKTMGNLNLLVSILSILVIIIVSTCCGFLCYIYFYQRKHEFGLVWALGYTRQEIINRTFLEIILMNGFGLIFGVLGALISGLALNAFFLESIGQPLTIISGDLIIRALCVSVISTLLSFLPIWRFLKGLEPILSIEGVD